MVQRGQLLYGAEDAGLRGQVLMLYKSVVWFGSLARVGFVGAVGAGLISASTAVLYFYCVIFVLILRVFRS